MTTAIKGPPIGAEVVVLLPTGRQDRGEFAGSVTAACGETVLVVFSGSSPLVYVNGGYEMIGFTWVALDQVVSW